MIYGESDKCVSFQFVCLYHYYSRAWLNTLIKGRQLKQAGILFDSFNFSKWVLLVKLKKVALIRNKRGTSFLEEQFLMI